MKGWHRESIRHSLARKGIKTATHRNMKIKKKPTEVKVKIWFGSSDFLNILKKHKIKYEYDKENNFVYIKE